MFEIEIDTDVFVWRVGTCVGVAQPGSRHGKLQIMYERIAGTGSPNQGDQLHRHLKDLLCCFCNELDKRLVRIRARRWISPEIRDLYITKTFCIEVGAQLFQNISWKLVGHETKIYFGRSSRRKHSFRARALITGCQPAD